MENSHVKLPVDVLKNAIERFGVKVPTVGKANAKAKTRTVDLAKAPKLFSNILLQLELGAPLRAKVEKHAESNAQKLAETRVSSVRELRGVLDSIHKLDKGRAWLERKIAGRFYPMRAEVGVSQSFFGAFYYITSTGQICDRHDAVTHRITDQHFKDEFDVAEPIRVRDLLEKLDLRVASDATRAEFRERSARAATLRGKSGEVLDVASKVLLPSRFFWSIRLLPIRFGTEDNPKRLIVESELEIENDYVEDDDAVVLPFVRCWSSDLKKYVYADIDDVVPHAYHPDPRSKLVLPHKMRTVLDAVFEQHTDAAFGDAFRGRYGGVVILANGPSGVGKTLTAEVYAEYTHRPLYVLEMGELGTTLDAVEENLQRVFARAARWNAILLFDEADIFLSKRQESDLERSAIVGVFLRLLDQYQGTFFLTTNRAEVIDDAFKSRITLKIDYPKLETESRARIWELMLEASGFHVDGSLERVAESELNGRQIRNQVRLLGALHPTKRAKVEDVVDAMEYAAR